MLKQGTKFMVRWTDGSVDAFTDINLLDVLAGHSVDDISDSFFSLASFAEESFVAVDILAHAMMRGWSMSGRLPNGDLQALNHKWIAKISVSEPEDEEEVA